AHRARLLTDRLGAAQPDRRTAWDWVTRATSRPSPSTTSVSMTITVRPACRGRDADSMWPPRTAGRKLVLDSMVVVPAAPSCRFRSGPSGGDAGMAGDIVAHYELDYDESGRITKGYLQLELVRTREIVRRHLPRGPLRVLDVGGGTGVHARWLAEEGHEVLLVDLVPRHVQAARASAEEGLNVTAELGDARQLDLPDESFDAALLL